MSSFFGERREFAGEGRKFVGESFFRPKDVENH